MLDRSCPACNFPLLKERATGKIYCGYCSREVKYVDTLDSKANVKPVEQLAPIASATQGHEIDRLRSILLFKLEQLIPRVETETDDKALYKLLRMTNKILNILSKLQSLKPNGD